MSGPTRQQVRGAALCSSGPPPARPVAAVAAPLVAIVGPTASGKSALALRLARERGGEIVSCDSLQVYRGLDVGSAKATPEERAAVPHHLLDVADPGEAFSAADYARLARAGPRRDPLRGAGSRSWPEGPGLYLRALLQGLFAGPLARRRPPRAGSRRLAERFGDARLHRLLARVDPEAAARIPPRDRVRVVRALEVYRATGRPITEGHRGGTVPLRGLPSARRRPRPRPGRRCAGRSRRAPGGCSSGGWSTRCAASSPAASPEAAAARRPSATGRRCAVVRGELGVEEAERAIVTETMRFAKRQRTWFRHQAEVAWFPRRRTRRSPRCWPGSTRRPPGIGANSLT